MKRPHAGKPHRPLLISALCLVLLASAFGGCRRPAPEPSSDAPSGTEAVTQETGPEAPETDPLPTYAQSPDVVPEACPLPDALSGSGQEAAPAAASETGVDYEQMLARKNQVFRPDSAVIRAEADLAPAPAARFTLMVYMTGSNLESHYGAASADIEEMLASGLSSPDVNVIVYTGGAQMWQADIPASCNTVIDLFGAPGSRIAGRTEGNADMGAPQTLSSFLDFAVTYYPAARYGLIFWDHGGGPLWGYGSDELFSDDSLMLAELAAAFDASPFSGGRRLDLVGFDACLMGSLETALQLSAYADWMVASEELEPGDGWDYGFLTVLDETDDPAAVGRRIVGDFASYYEANATDSWHPDATLALYDLSQAAATARQVGRLFSRMAGGLSRGDDAAISQARTEARSFGVVEDRTSGFYHYDLVDLADLAGRLSSLYPSECRAVTQALSLFVAENAANVPGAGGVSLYYPSRNKGQFEKMSPLIRELAVSDSCRAFLDGMTSLWLYSKSRDWVLGALQPGDGEWLLPLTEEQAGSLASARYTILRDAGTGYYLPCLSDCLIVPDEEGVLHIPADPQIFLLQTDLGETAFWNTVQTESNAVRETYRTVNTRLVSDPDFALRQDDADTVRVSVAFSVDPATGAVTAGNVTSAGSDAGAVGKETVDLSLWEGVFWHCTASVPTRDFAGRLLPYDEWNSTAELTYAIRSPYRDSFTFSRVPASSAAGHFLVQVVIEDTGGERYATELTPLALEDFTETTLATPQGRLTFRVYPDHAEALRYLGSDETLTIPAEAGGQPVTAIGNGCFSPAVTGLAASSADLRQITLPETLAEIGPNAFFSCPYLEAVDIPEGVTSIGSSAFAGCISLEEVRLPDSLTSLGKCAFDGCASLTSVTLPPRLPLLADGVFTLCLSLADIRGEGLSGYRVTDGVLFSEDGTVLLAFPAARTGAYEIPAGTQAVGFGAFSCTNLTSVSLPADTAVLDGYAFYAADSLSVPDFPEGLRAIGHQAFGSTRTAALPQPAAIRLPASLASLSAGAFDAWPWRTFAVAEDSQTFAAADGHLTSKAGDRLIALAWDHTRQFAVPDGITRFDWSLFDFLSDTPDDPRYEHVDLSLPDSVVSVTGSPAFWVMNDLTLHASPGSEAQRYAEANAIAWDPEPVKPYVLREVPVPDGTLFVRLYDDHAQLMLYTGTARELVLPETIEGLPLTVIGGGKAPVEYAPYYDYSELGLTGDPDTVSLERLVLPETVTTLSANSLLNSATACRGMDLPPGLAVIGDQALPSHGASPWELPGRLVSLGRYFAQDPGPIPVSADLVYVAPNAVARVPGAAGFVQTGPNERFSVAGGALLSADGATLLLWPFTAEEGAPALPEGITAIGPYALAYTGYPSVTLPETVTAIAEYAFAGCRSLAGLTLPQAVDSVGSYAFAWCDALAAVDGAQGVKEIGDHAFYGDAALRTFAFGPALTVIEDSAFEGSGVRPEDLPDSLAYIGDSAFADLRLPDGMPPYTLHIGPDVRHIGSEAFSGAGAQDFSVGDGSRVCSAHDGFLCDPTGQVLLACPSGRTGTVTVPDGTVMIAAGAFAGCYGVTDVVIPEEVVHVSSLAFPWYYFTHDDDGTIVWHYESWLTLHVPAGSAAERLAITYDLPYVTE